MSLDILHCGNQPIKINLQDKLCGIIIKIMLSQTAGNRKSAPLWCHKGVTTPLLFFLTTSFHQLLAPPLLTIPCDLAPLTQTCSHASSEVHVKFSRTWAANRGLNMLLLFFLPGYKTADVSDNTRIITWSSSKVPRCPIRIRSRYLTYPWCRKKRSRRWWRWRSRRQRRRRRRGEEEEKGGDVGGGGKGRGWGSQRSRRRRGADEGELAALCWRAPPRCQAAARWWPMTSAQRLLCDWDCGSSAELSMFAFFPSLSPLLLPEGLF